MRDSILQPLLHRLIPGIVCLWVVLASNFIMGADVGFACSGDIEPDGDVDGSDLAAYISGSTRIDLGDFAANFGRTGCIVFPPAPLNQFNIGDSIGEGEAASGVIGATHHETVWSTGYDGYDVVYTLNEHFEDADPSGYYENNAERDSLFNLAVSGSIMAGFETQAEEIVATANSTPSGKAGMITILLGNNDVCASSLDAMTDPLVFENQYRAGLDVLAGSDSTKNAYIHVSSIPAIYWLWNAKWKRFWCRVIVWPFVPCENLLENPTDDCVNEESRLDPDTIDEGDGDNCIRRKQFHAKIRDIYNPILENVLQEYIDDGRLPNAYFVDIFDIQFEDDHVNDGDCFHPSILGHELLADEQRCRSPWGMEDPGCMY